MRTGFEDASLALRIESILWGFEDASLALRIESILWQDWIGWVLTYRLTPRFIDSTVALMRLYCWTGAALRAVVEVG